MNKKKIIIILLVTILLIGASIGVVLLTSGKEDNEEKSIKETTTQNQLKEEKNKTSIEKETLTQEEVGSESVSEEASTEENNNTNETNNIDKDKYYLDENGVPQLKEEPSNNSTYTYREDIKSSQDAIIYLRSLGYTVSDVPTEAEVRAIYKEHSYIVSEAEFEESLVSDGVNLTLRGIAYNLLPSNGTSNSQVYNDSFDGEKVVGEITYNSQSTWQPSNEPTEPSGPSLSDFENYDDVNDNMLDGMSEKDNIFK